MLSLEDAFIDLVHAEMKAPSWVITDLLPVGLTFLSGPPKKSYKSTITIIEACLAARWSTNALPRWATCILGGPTMIFSGEAQAGEILWVVKEGLQVEPEEGKVLIADDLTNFMLHDVASRDRLLAFLEQRKPRVLIMDPFRNMWLGDENDSGAIISMLAPVRDWLHENDAAGIMVHHINKPSKDSSEVGNMYTMRGSSAMPGLADGIIIVEPTRHEGQITLHATFKRGESWHRTVMLGVPGYGWPSQGYEVLGEHADALETMWRASRTKGLELATEMAQAAGNTATMRDILRALVRNERLTLNAMERAMFLGEAQ